MKTGTKTGDRGRLREGDLLYDRYEIRSQLGAGGFAVVYEAFDRTIERRVALKVLDIQHMGGTDDHTEQVLDRFLREARLAARIRHPSIIEIFDFGVFEGDEQPYIIMEFLEGTDLERELTSAGPMEPARYFPLFCGALDALGEAHDEGVVHKDLKPANLFLSDPGSRKETLKIVDFGIAHVNAPDKKRLTKTGLMSGTPQYLSPEYIEAQTVSPAMDIYQMGLILIEGLTGEPVVRESTPYQAAFKHVERELDIPVGLLDSELGEVLDRALAYEPEDRFDSPEEFSDALAAVDPDDVTIDDSVTDQQFRSPVSPVADTDLSAAPGDSDRRESSEKAFADTLANHQPSSADESGQQAPGDDASGRDPSVRLESRFSEADDVSDQERQEKSAVPTDEVDERREADETSSRESPGTAGPGRGVVVAAVVAASVALLAGGLVAGLFIFLQLDDSAQDEGGEPTSTVAERQEEPEEIEEPADPKEEMEETGFALQVVSEPDNANVERKDGTELGTTPLEISGDEGEQLEVTVDREGYRPEERTVDGSVGSELVVELEPKPEPEPEPAPTPDPEPKPAPELEPEPEPEPEPASEPEQEAELDTEEDEELDPEERREMQLAP